MANGNQIPTGITILNSYLGYFGVSLTNFNTSASTAIASGSKIEIAGAFFTFTADDTPDATSWTAITTATTAYIALTPSGTAGSQILTTSWVSTTPVWSTSKQGWYTSAGSSIRLVASVYKTSATQYDNKAILTGWQVENSHGSKRFVSDGTWTAPSGVYRVWLTGCGEGGVGADGTGVLNGGVGGGGGGGAGFCIKYETAVVPLTSYAVTIGNSTAGTSFGSLLHLYNGVAAVGINGGNGGSTSPSADNAYIFTGLGGGNGGNFTAGTPATRGIQGIYGGQAGMGAAASWYNDGSNPSVLVSGGGGGGQSFGNGGDGCQWCAGSISPIAGAGNWGGGGGGGSNAYPVATPYQGGSQGRGFLTVEW